MFEGDEFIGIREKKEDTERESKAKKGEFDQAFEILTHSNKRRTGALPSLKKFDWTELPSLSKMKSIFMGTILLSEQRRELNMAKMSCRTLFLAK